MDPHIIRQEKVQESVALGELLVTFTSGKKTNMNAGNQLVTIFILIFLQGKMQNMLLPTSQM